MNGAQKGRRMIAVEGGSCREVEVLMRISRYGLFFIELKATIARELCLYVMMNLVGGYERV